MTDSGDAGHSPSTGVEPARDDVLVRDLLRPDAYPWHPPAVEVIETHVSWVFMAGDRVVKVKRPVVFPFVDHRSRAQREQSCRDEVRLNRRLTSGVYLGVAPIVQTPEGPRVAEEGPHIEWATVMRRLPAEGMLDALLARDAAPPDLANRLAERLIPFHRDTAPICPGNAGEVAASATSVVTENLAELEPYAGAPIDAGQFALVASAMRAFIMGHGNLFQARAEAGWVREGHGDLRAEHVCLEPDGATQIFDCVEFNRDVRCADIASDLAYLLMDLIRLGAPEVAADLLERYRAAGIDLPDTLLHLYGAHRALVRAKISSIDFASAQDDAGRAESRAAAAADYLDMASASALTMRPGLIAMTGLSGAGKSSVARRLCRALGVPLYASDVVRKELAGINGPAPAAWGEGVYRPAMTGATYDRLFDLAAEQLAAGSPVILDAAFLSRAQRDGAARVADAAGVPLVLVEAVCDEAEVAERLIARAARGDSPSDATLETYRRQREMVAETPAGIPEGALAVQIDTSGRPPIRLGDALTALARKEMIESSLPGSDSG